MAPIGCLLACGRGQWNFVEMVEILLVADLEICHHKFPI